MQRTDHFLSTRPSFGEWDGQVANWIEVKEDGWRLTVVKRDGKITAFSKKPTVDLWPKVQRNDQVRQAVLSLPDNTIVDGEAHIPGGLSSDVPTALIEGEGWRFSTFALPWIGGRDLRKRDLPYVRDTLSTFGFDTTHCVAFRKVYGDVDRDWLKHDASVRQIEGYVLKLQHWLCWYRVKPKRTADVIVMSKYEGQNRLVGSLGGFVVGVWTNGDLVEIGRCGGGFSDPQRGEFWSTDQVGRVCEVEYDSITSGGRLRFPQFIRWRDDKEARDCGLGQVK